jgi:hypothetical protein
MQEIEEAEFWLDRWIAEDFSWAGITNKPSWDSGAQNLQEFLRSYTRTRRTDEQLISDGLLVGCGKYGLFHVIFVPPDWTGEGGVASLAQEDLISRQESAWSVIRSAKIRDMFAGTISGPHIPESVAPSLLSTRASFAWTSFRGRLASIPTRHQRLFENCAFQGRITLAEKLNENRLPKVAFRKCEIDADVRLYGLEGVQELAFEESHISGNLDFRDVCDARIKIYNSSIATFDSFAGCEFRQDVEFFESVVEKRMSLSNCTFERPFSLVATQFDRAIELLDCDFKGRVTFAEVSWPTPKPMTASAGGCKFFATVSFNGDQPPPIQFFQNAEFESSVSFSPISNSRLLGAFYDELRASSNEDESAHDRSQHAQTVENGCRTLRKLAEDRGDVHQEHFWHRAEIISRRATGENAFSEKGFSHLYGWLADYGLSISRPFFALAVSTICFAFLYAWLGGETWIGAVDIRSIGEGFGYSLNRTLPIGVFVDENDTWRKELLGGGGHITSIAIRMIATLQTVFSAVLIYLGVMAIRRKFRIS